MIRTLVYTLDSAFSSPIAKQCFVARVKPRRSEKVKIIKEKIKLYPDMAISEGTDSGQNRFLMGFCNLRHDTFSITAESTVNTLSILEKEVRGDLFLGPYRSSSKLTVAGPAIKALHETLPATFASPWKRCELVIETIAENFYYETGCTSVSTSAEEALELGKGVCQDYAHILLALLRMDKIAARYTSGAVRGEGASHAWVEVYENGYWKGYDPTRGREADETYLTLAVGRDASSYPLFSGSYFGGAVESQMVRIAEE